MPRKWEHDDPAGEAASPLTDWKKADGSRRPYLTVTPLHPSLYEVNDRSGNRYEVLVMADGSHEVTYPTTIDREAKRRILKAVRRFEGEKN